MLSAQVRYELPALAERVATEYPGVTLRLVAGDPTLTIGPGVTEAQKRAAVALVATLLDDFRLVTPDDPPRHTMPDGWAEAHRRGGHHLDLYNASAFR